MHYFKIERTPCLWLLVSSSFPPFQVVYIIEQQVTISFVVYSASFYFTGVYASANQRVCRALWDDLKSVHVMAPSL